ncbi:MAG: TetM/TetW/TetO/TetS family tetracycline resistance ribosomal protection protein [Longicatena sp.]
MKNLIIGTLAHVDAGKTTLSESMLVLSGTLRKAGRVDHKDTFLDYDEQERNRGITIYSKQAMFQWRNTTFTLLDTPGHIDFSAEMERALQVLDYAIIVISALDGIQVHSETIWSLLKHYHIPTFIFINKMDITHFKKEALMSELEERFSSACIDFTMQDNEWLEKISLCDETLLNEYIDTQNISQNAIQEYVSNRLIVPCYFGSALKNEGVEALLDGIEQYTKKINYPSEFGACVYKITRDEQGNKLTHMKITGGTLKAKEKLNDVEKVDQIRLYSGSKFQVVNQVEAGQVCALKGLKHVGIGAGFGIQEDAQSAMLTSYLCYKLLLPEGSNVATMYKNLLLLEQVDPQLCIHFNELQQEITIQVMGEIQMEVLKHTIKERMNVEVDFDQGSVVYKETITESVEGVGHFEPLRHYAEVHLLLEPLERNSGLVFESDCSEDVLARQWQRLVLTHLQECVHVGVLTRSPICDMKITLIGGKAHLKHTEGGDFREATYRALRQGLKSTTSMLLEPYYAFRMDVPQAYLSRAMHDLQMRHATFEIMQENNDFVQLQGSAPVVSMQHYQIELLSYTKGKGKLSAHLAGYEECIQASEVIEKIGYDSERDIEHPTGSLFCEHGAKFYVPWNEVKDHMHVKACWKQHVKQSIETRITQNYHIDDAEVERVMRMTYGEVKPQTKQKKIVQKVVNNECNKTKPICYLIDGYNIVHDWDTLRDIARDNLDGARTQLINYMSSFQGYKKCLLILVFDAYKVPVGTQSEHYNGSIYIVYTKAGQTADSYIEKTTRELSEKYQIIVATSDALEQLVVNAQGALRLSARELQREFEYCSKRNVSEYESRQSKVGNRALEDLRKINE